MLTYIAMQGCLRIWEKRGGEKERDRESNEKDSLALFLICPEVNESLARCLSQRLTGKVLMVG